MRKTFVVVMAAVLAFGLAFAAPAAAAPENSPQVSTYAVTCGARSFTVTAYVVPGWESGAPGTPSLLLGGTFTLQEESGAGWVTVFSFDKLTPPGLGAKLVTCQVVGPLEPVGYRWVIDPAYLLYTPQS